MFKNYIKVILRNLFRHKIYTFFSVISLTIGLLCSIFAYLYITHELSYDTFLEHSDQIVRLNYQSSFQTGSAVNHAILPGQYVPPQLSSIPSIQQKTRFAQLPPLFVTFKNQNRIVENYGFAADSIFFDVFDFQLVTGDKKNLLVKPNSIVLTEETARKYFGSENPIGKTLKITFRKRQIALTVTAVMENVPTNSHLKFDFLISEGAYKDLFGVDFSESYTAYQYLLLSENTDSKVLERKLNKLKRESNDANFKYISYRVQPIIDIHLYSSAQGEIKPNSNILYIYIFGIVAIIILIISCINYTALFISESVYKFKEISMRKILGAKALQLIIKLLLESVIIAVISFFVALIIAYLLLPAFNTLSGKSFVFHEFLSLGLIWKGMFFSIIIGVLSGLYPTWVIFAKNKTCIPRINAMVGTKKSLFQNSIIIIQFAASTILIIGTLVIYSQLNYIQQKDLGFSTERVIIATNHLGSQSSLFKQLLSDNRNIENITFSSYIPGVSEAGGTALVKSQSNAEEISTNWIAVDYNFFETYNIPLVKGRYFSKQYATDSTKAFLVNQATVEALRLKNPIGKRLYAFQKVGEIIGVVKNFNYLSLHQQIPPMLFLIYDDLYFSLSIKLSSNANVSATLNQIEKAWYKVQPDVPFDYTFLQGRMNKLYESERNVGKTVFSFSIIALIVSCLGLFSLAAYSMQKRTKEIGIRKVLGATSKNILMLFYGKYFKLIFIANLAALPITYLLLRNWLTNFAYKIDISILPFLISFIITSVLTIIALSYWALKAAWINPVDSIQTE